MRAFQARRAGAVAERTLGRPRQGRWRPARVARGAARGAGNPRKAMRCGHGARHGL